MNQVKFIYQLPDPFRNALRCSLAFIIFIEGQAQKHSPQFATCPTDALALVGSTAVVIKPAACNYCAQCETICPVEAIALPYQIVLESNL